MNLIDRLIAKAKTIRLSYGDDVFIISNETGEWMADGQEFLDLGAAQGYVENLIPDDAFDYTVIINDVGPSDMAALGKLAAPSDWLDRIKRKNIERRRRERAKERMNRPPKKDRQLI